MLRIAIAFALTSACFAQTAVDGRAGAQLLRKRFTSATTEKDREYFLLLPRGYESEKGRKWPVLLFLHGGGERGDGLGDLEKVLAHGPLMEAWTKNRDLPFVMISPQMPAMEQATRPAAAPPANAARRPSAPIMTRQMREDAPRWNEEGPPLGWWVNEKDVLKMVDDTLRDYRTDADRVYVTGLSYGGFGTWHFAGAHPDRWDAVAPICGAANPKLIAPIAAAKLPIWIVQGGLDPVVRPEWVLASAAALQKAGHPAVRFTVHEDMQHNVWMRAYEGWDLYNWLLSHRRGQTAAK
ncbi:MAG: prolyl oligopeptidase family serine peptidase [Candidatus Solibacter usitatus]|nr:prolyl oligopeptidase family serine peptidase [Candidatus Solibacter usitatus]